MKQTIKLTYTDNDHTITWANGTVDDISRYYGENNFMSWICNGSRQVSKIEFMESECSDYIFVDKFGNGILR